jgi:nicotinamidase-related amidase
LNAQTAAQHTELGGDEISGEAAQCADCASTHVAPWAATATHFFSGGECYAQPSPVLRAAYIRQRRTRPDRSPGRPIIDRSSVKAFDDPRVASAIEATGRRTLIFAGLSLEVCAAFPAIMAVNKGLDAYVAVDACGTFSETKHKVGLLKPGPPAWPNPRIGRSGLQQHYPASITLAQTDLRGRRRLSRRRRSRH